MRDSRERLDRLGDALLKAAPPVPPGFSASVMAMIQAEEQRTTRARLPRNQLRRRWWRAAMGLTAAVLSIGASVSVARASDRTLPGEPLYSVRTAREGFALALAPDQTARDALALGFAQERVADLHRALVLHAGPPVAQAVMRALITYNRAVSPAHLPWLRDALTSQYLAVLQDRRLVLHNYQRAQESVAQAVDRDLTTGLAQLRALARTAGAAWARNGADTPPQEPAPDGPA